MKHCNLVKKTTPAIELLRADNLPKANGDPSQFVWLSEPNVKFYVCLETLHICRPDVMYHAT